MAKGKQAPFIRWWNANGQNMAVQSVDTAERRIVIGSSFGRMRLEIWRPEPLGDWVVKWHVRQSDKSDDTRNWIGGERTFTHNEIRCAFGLEDKVRHSFTKDLDEQLCRKYLADAAVVGKFMRQGNRLNIPCNNTNFESYKAVSLRVTKDMQRLFLDTSSPGDTKRLAHAWPAQ